MATTYININGEKREASSLQLPSTARAFRDAWQFNGSVVEVDPVKAKEIQINRLAQEALDAAREAELDEHKAKMRGDTGAAASAAARLNKYKNGPKRVLADMPVDELTNASLADIFD